MSENQQEMVEIDRETLLTLRSLVHSVEVSLSGLDDRLKKELEVIEVSVALSERARDLLNRVLIRKEPES